MTSEHKPAQNPNRDAPSKASLPKSAPMNDRPWPPLIYHAHVPLHIKLRDLLITLAGWLLIVDLLEDIWVLITQWLHLTVFKRKVEMDHLMLTLWGNIHEFFYLSMTFVAVVVLVGLSRWKALRKPLKGRFVSRAAKQRINNEKPQHHKGLTMSSTKTQRVTRVSAGASND